MDPNKNHYIVVTGIIVKDGRYLINKFSGNHKAFPNQWTVPGGKLEVNDYRDREKDTSVHWYNVLESVLRREVKEEVGLEIKNLKYLTSLSYIRSDNIPTLIISLFADYHDGEVVLGDDMEDHKWVSLEEAKEYDLIEGIYDELVMLDKILNNQEVGEWEKEGGFIIDDSVYGKFEVTENVLIELINSRPMQRLKGVAQYGMPDDYYHKKGFSRYDHSLGVFLFLRKIGAGLEEQIAGLLHDVSHTAFSHVIDRILGDPEKEDYQDNNHLNIIESTEIKDILEKYGYSYKRIADMESFSLLETEIPSLCADRIDYSLRELFYEGIDVSEFVKSLSSFNGQVVFNDRDVAFKFSEMFLNLQNEHWAGTQAVIRYEVLGGILRRALDIGIINEKDFYREDREILNLLENSGDIFIKKDLDLLKGSIAVDYTEGEGISLKKKFRYIDPEVLIDEKIFRLSELSSEYNDVLDREKRDSMIERKVVYNKG